jgi:hypothetical protein
MGKRYASSLYILPLLAVLFLPDAATANLEKAIPQNAQEVRFLRCLRLVHRTDRIPLTPQQEALILAEDRDRRASQKEKWIFHALDSKRAQKIRAEAEAYALRRYGCLLR